MDYKKCNCFIDHRGFNVRITGIKKWNTERNYYDIRNEHGYIGYIRCNGLRYVTTIFYNTDEVIKFYETI
jgi:hypothetical protein